MAKFILALDQGTSSSRAMVLADSGRVVSIAQRDFAQHFPKPGWVEHDPADLWESQVGAAKEAIAKASIGAYEVAAIGIANQRETTLLWDRKTGEPVGQAIVWQDRRTSSDCDALRKDGVEAWIAERTGLVLDSYFSATKVAWMLKHIPGTRARAERGELAFGTVDSYLVWRLTGGRRHVTDPSNASRTLLYDLHSGGWSRPLLDLFDIPVSLLPEIVPSSGVLGESDPEIFGAPIPIAGLIGDQQAATFGQACFRPGSAKNTYGTGGFALMNLDNRPALSPAGLLTSVGWKIGSEPPIFVREGSVFIAGAAIQWLRDELGIIGSADESSALAGTIDDTEGVYFVPAFVGLGAPHWDARARGTIVGLTRGAGRAHLVRSTLESIAYQTHDVLAAMQSGTCGTSISELRVDGGGSRNDFLMQFQADILGLPVIRAAQSESTALGVAYLAGLGVGVWENLSAIEPLWQGGRCFDPQMPVSVRDRKLEGWNQAIERAKSWADA